MITIHVARKPLKGSTVAQNALSHGTGGLNVDGCRIPVGEDEHIEKRPILKPSWNSTGRTMNGGGPGATAEKSQAAIHAGIDKYNQMGRFPANLILGEGVELPDHDERFFHRVGDK